MENISKQKKVYYLTSAAMQMYTSKMITQNTSNVIMLSINVKEIHVLFEGRMNIVDGYSPRMPIPQLNCPGKH